MQPKALLRLHSSGLDRKRRDHWWTSSPSTVVLIKITLGFALYSLIYSGKSYSSLGLQRYDSQNAFLRSHRAEPSKLHADPLQLGGRPSDPQELGGSPRDQQELGARPSDEDRRCKGKYVYIYKLPREFNEDLVDKCGRLTENWVPLCGNLNNNGFGPNVPRTLWNDKDVSMVLRPPHAWFRTEQFSLELLFHERLKEYPCLTQDPKLATALYIPYYAALDAAFTLFSPQLHIRDRLVQRLLGWLSGNPTWTKFKGEKKHFMALGRISWDFSRSEDSLTGWGSALLSQPELANVTKLLIERKTWTHDEIAIPYPTSFHPSSDRDLKLWQDNLRKGPKREWLCSFIGSTSRGTEWSRALRAELAMQCDRAENGTCREVKCNEYGMPGTVDCTRRPEHVTALFRSSTFCLQPPGDSPTRKGIFDSLLAGCIPVLFSEASAYTQYTWHLPQNGSLYSIFFDGDDVATGKVDIIASLARIAKNTRRLRRLQEAVVHMLPRILYALPTTNNHSRVTFHDAVDVALENFLGGSPNPKF